jgi:hypothetical protein
MVDTTAQIDAVTRGLRIAELDGAEVRVQTLSQRYAASVEDVWDAVTSPDRIPRWFAPVTVDARIGGRYQIEGNAGGEVLECRPPADGRAGYRVTWEFAGGVSWLQIDLAADDADRTRLTLTHTGRSADVPPGFWEQFGPGATGVGWDLAMLGLALHLADPAAEVARDHAEQWQTGPEGIAFSRGAADAWARAHIEAGADPEAARRAAEGTFAFYTGQEPPAS